VYRSFARHARIVDGEALDDLLRHNRVIFEGSQGVLLDQDHGFHPYTTWSKTTYANVDSLLAQAGVDRSEVYRLGLVRAVTTRHGNGPHPTEDSELTATVREAHNSYGVHQGAFRVGHFDAVAHRYAIQACGGVEGLAVSHLDLLEAGLAVRVCDRYHQPDGSITVELPQPGSLADQEALTRIVQTATPAYQTGLCSLGAIQDAVAQTVVLAAYGPTAQHRSAPGSVAAAA
jgi:adenylosuccinate synthase